MDFMKLKATLSLDSSEYESGLDKAEGKTGKLKKGLVAFGKVSVAAIGAAASATGVLIKKSVDAYGEFEQLSGGAKLLFGDAFEFIENRAANAYANVQMSQNEYLQQVNGFAVGLKTALGGNEQAAAQLADKIITAEADIVAATGNTQENVQNAFNGIMKGNYMMLDNLQIGITPTKAGMQEVIDKVNEWNEAQGKASNYTIDNFADVQSALIDYIDMQGLSGYAANEAADTIQGSLASVRASWENLLVGFANPDANIAELVQNLIESASSAAGNLMPAIMQALEGVGEAFTTILPELVAKIPDALNTMAEPLLTTGVNLVMSLVQGLTDSAPQLVNSAITLIGNLATYLIQQAPQLIVAGINLITSLVQGLGSGDGQILDTVINIISALVVTIVTSLPQIIGAVWNLLTAVVKTFSKVNWLELGKRAFEKVKNGIANVLPKIKTVVSAAVRYVLRKLGFAGAAAKAKQAFENIKKGISDKIEAAKKKVKEVIDKIKGFFPFNVGKIFSGWIPKISLKTNKSGDSASTSSSVGQTHFAKAMSRPYLMTRDTLVNQYAGHAWGGGEIMYGRNNLMSDIREAVGGGGDTEALAEMIGEIVGERVADALEGMDIVLDKRSFGKMTRRMVGA